MCVNRFEFGSRIKMISFSQTVFRFLLLGSKNTFETAIFVLNWKIFFLKNIGLGLYQVVGKLWCDLCTKWVHSTPNIPNSIIWNENFFPANLLENGVFSFPFIILPNGGFSIMGQLNSASVFFKWNTF